MTKIKNWLKANQLLEQLKNDLPTLATKDEKLALLNEFEKLIGHNGLAVYVDLVLEKLKDEVNAQA